MTSYGQDVTELAGCLAQLLVQGTTTPPARYPDPDAVLAARDIVLSGVRGAYLAAAHRVCLPQPGSPVLQALDPSRALGDALSALPIAAPHVAPSHAAELPLDSGPGILWRRSAA